MSKRVSLNDRLKDDNKTSKAVAAYISTNEDINNDGIIDVAENIDINVLDDTSVNVNVYKNINNDISSDVSDNGDVSRIIIRKQSKQEVPKRATYYLLPNTIKRIEKLSKETGVGKSALVQKLLDEALSLVDIE